LVNLLQSVCVSLLFSVDHKLDFDAQPIVSAEKIIFNASDMIRQSALVVYIEI
jgi:hypothetical protein